MIEGKRYEQAGQTLEYCPFPYSTETFNEEEKAVLLRYFTNYDKPVYAIRPNLPQEVVGALLSRFSRTSLSIRRIFLNEFYKASELGIQNITAFLVENQGAELDVANERAKAFYKNALAEYGDESVKQMGNAHIVFEGVSQIAAKAIEDGRPGSAFIEKSTRYVDFGNLVDGHYLYCEPQEIMHSKFAEEFTAWNIATFEAYKKHYPITIEFLRAKYPMLDLEIDITTCGMKSSSNKYDDLNGELQKLAKRAYERALKAKAFDLVRVFLPTTTVTNIGANFSGQAAEHTINKLMASPFAEVRFLGNLALEELAKVTPNFLLEIQTYGVGIRRYMEEVRFRQEILAEWHASSIKEVDDSAEVRLVDYDTDTDVQIAAEIIYGAQTRTHYSKGAILEWARKVKEQDKQADSIAIWSKRLTDVIVDSVPSRANRRNKLPRAFERAEAEVEFNCDFGIFRDLQRNRFNMTSRQRLNATKIFVPEEFREPGMEEVLVDYTKMALWTKSLNSRIAESGAAQTARAAEYVTILGNKLRFNIKANLRQWCFFAELRTIPGGHPTYRHAVQEAARQIFEIIPFLKDLFSNIDWKEDYGLGRLKAEIKTQQKLEKTS